MLFYECSIRNFLVHGTGVSGPTIKITYISSNVRFIVAITNCVRSLFYVNGLDSVLRDEIQQKSLCV